MKIKTLTFIKSTTLVVFSFFFMSMQANAQSFQIATATQDVVLDPADVSGSYVIQVPITSGQNGTTAQYLTTEANLESVEASTNPDVQNVIVLEKLANGNYYLKAGDKKANYNTNAWNIVFDNTTTTNIEWIINVTGTNTITIQKKVGSYVKCEFANNRNRIYSNGDATQIATFTLKKVLTSATVNLPVAADYTSTSETLIADADLTGKYLIQNETGGYMTPNLSLTSDISLVSTANANYAFDLSKQADGTYTISCGGSQLVYLHNWLVCTDYLPLTRNTWTITVVDGNKVTIQRASNGQYLKNSLNNGSYKYYSDASVADNVQYSLLKVTGVATGHSSVMNDRIRSNVYQSAGKLIITNTSNVKAIAIYTVGGQQIFEENVNSAEVSISAKNWSKGIYVLKLTDNNGSCKNIKTLVI